MAVILDLSANQPQSTLSDSPVAMRGPSAHWKFSITPDHASSAIPDFFEIIFGFGPAGDYAFALSDDGTDGGFQVFTTLGGVCIGTGITWSASQTITFEVDNAIGRVIVTGATTGNGTYDYWTGTVPWTFDSGTLYIGQSSSSGFPYSGSISNVEDFTIAGTAAASITEITTAAAGALTIASTGAASIDEITASASGTVGGSEITSTAAASIDEVTAAATGALTIVGSNVSLAISAIPAVVADSAPQMRTGNWQFTATPAFSSASMIADDTHRMFEFPGGRSVSLRHTGVQPVFFVRFYNPSGIESFAQLPLTWSAGQTLQFLVDAAAGTIDVSGATDGNGVFSPHPETWDLPSGTLYVGRNAGGTAVFNGTLSDVTSHAVTGGWVGAASGDLVGAISCAAAASITEIAASATGALAIVGTAGASFGLDPFASITVGPQPITGFAAAVDAGFTGASLGELYWEVRVYAPDGTTYPDDEALPIDDDGKTVRRTERITNSVLRGDLLTYDDEIL